MVNKNSDGLVDSSQDLRAEGIDWLPRFEWIVAVVLSAIVLFLLITRTIHAGPLDRDECDSLNLARMPSWADLVGYLQYTAFPILFPATVRSYTALFGSADLTLRYFGLATGILMLAIAWLHSWNVNRGPPLLLPMLIGLNANFLTTGTFLRGYGLGSVLIIAVFVLMEKMLLKPATKPLVALFLVALAAAQVVFFNAALLPSIAFAAAVVLFLNRQYKWMGLLASAVTVCGLFYIPYFVFVFPKVSKYAQVVALPMPLSAIWTELLIACGESHVALSGFWLGIVVLAVIGAVWRLRFRREASSERSMLMFGLVTIVTCALTYLVFLLLAHDRLRERHYLALICVLAIAADLIVANLCRDRLVRIARLIFVLTGIVIFPLAAWPRVIERQSNIDIIAARLQKEANPNDLIVVNPPWLGISFARYYRAQNRWVTVPEISDHQVHRYDLFQLKMMDFFPLRDLENEIESTLKSGHQVWFIGKLHMQRGSQWPRVLTPAPDPKYGWSNYAYTAAWAEELGFLFWQHAGKIKPVGIEEGSVRPWEHVTLSVATGWRY